VDDPVADRVRVKVERRRVVEVEALVSAHSLAADRAGPSQREGKQHLASASVFRAIVARWLVGMLLRSPP
jgi:hypothetical protein